jgi:hypothetical protein
VFWPILRLCHADEPELLCGPRNQLLDPADNAHQRAHAHHATGHVEYDPHAAGVGGGDNMDQILARADARVDFEEVLDGISRGTCPGADVALTRDPATVVAPNWRICVVQVGGDAGDRAALEPITARHG